MLPILFLLVLMLVQPAILLYDRVVMEDAAVEGCRLLVTYSDTAGSLSGGRVTVTGDGGAAEDYVRRRLGMIPQTSIFHVHDGGCSYRITLDGDEGSETVSVTIENDVRLLPLLGQAASALGYADGGIYHQKVTAELPAKPRWAQGDPGDWDDIWEE